VQLMLLRLRSRHFKHAVRMSCVCRKWIWSGGGNYALEDDHLANGAACREPLLLAAVSYLFVYNQCNLCMPPWSPYSHCGTVFISHIVVTLGPGILWAFCCIVSVCIELTVDVMTCRRTRSRR